MPKHITKVQKEEIVNFYKTRPMTQEEIAKKYNVSLSLCYKNTQRI